MMERAARVDNLTKEVQSICSKCDATQELSISRKVTGVCMLQDTVQDATAAQTHVLQLFLAFIKTRQAVTETLRAVDDELNQPDVSESKVSELSEKLATSEPILIECLERSQELNNQAQRAKVIVKMRGTQGEPSLLPQAELHNLKSRHDQLTLQLSSEQEKLSETAKLTKEFWEKQRNLSGWLFSVDADLETMKAKEPVACLDDLQDCLKEYQVIFEKQPFEDHLGTDFL